MGVKSKIFACGAHILAIAVPRPAAVPAHTSTIATHIVTCGGLTAITELITNFRGARVGGREYVGRSAPRPWTEGSAVIQDHFVSYVKGGTDKPATELSKICYI